MQVNKMKNFLNINKDIKEQVSSNPPSYDQHHVSKLTSNFKTEESFSYFRRPAATQL